MIDFRYDELIEGKIWHEYGNGGIIYLQSIIITDISKEKKTRYYNTYNIITFILEFIFILTINVKMYVIFLS